MAKKAKEKAEAKPVRGLRRVIEDGQLVILRRNPDGTLDRTYTVYTENTLSPSQLQALADKE